MTHDTQSALIRQACEAEEAFGLDELERHAAEIQTRLSYRVLMAADKPQPQTVATLKAILDDISTLLRRGIR